MKAIVLNRYGNAGDLLLQDMPKPVPATNEVLIKIHAAGVNFRDIGQGSGALKDYFPVDLPWIPGIDFAGMIEATGEDVRGFKPGDEVYGSNLDGGTYAEYITVDSSVVALKPCSLNFTEAASVPVSAQTAWQVLFHDAHINTGQTVLIHGGAGGVGAYVVQFAHQAGAKVIVSASEKDAGYLRSLGADEVLDYKIMPFESVVNYIDVVIDLVGGDANQRSYQVIKPGGYLVSTIQAPKHELAEKFKVKPIFSQLQPSTESLTRIAMLVDSGKLKIGLAGEYPLSDAAIAWNAMQGKAKTNGRLVLNIQ